MKTCNDYLDDLATKDRKEGGSGSDYKLAQLLGISKQKISYFRRHPLDDDTALKLAECLGRDPLELIAVAAAERTKSPAMKKRWGEVARSAAAVLALGITGLMAHPGTVEAAPGTSQSFNTGYVLYVISDGSKGCRYPYEYPLSRERLFLKKLFNLMIKKKKGPLIRSFLGLAIWFYVMFSVEDWPAVLMIDVHH